MSKLLLFLLLNFGALALGGLFTGKGVQSDWYAGLAKAPWTPPGWVFGAAWTTIMICFSVYLARLWGHAENQPLLISLFVLQWVLNVSWNPTFFYFHQTGLSLILISALTLLIGFLFIYYLKPMRWESVLLLPYFLWLLIATSLNGYIYYSN